MVKFETILILQTEHPGSEVPIAVVLRSTEQVAALTVLDNLVLLFDTR